ncbi:MAG TPA: hypothetical protein VIJ31_01510 [Acidothermaceae bacterium]
MLAFGLFMPPSVCVAIPDDSTTAAADLQASVSFGNLNEVDEHPWVRVALMVFDYARLLATKFRVST